jgi:hypothetical protein
LVHAKSVEFLWFCGCELVDSLTERELDAWQAGSAAWLAEASIDGLP